MTDGRAIQVQEHDDGLNAWMSARVSAPRELNEAIYGYSDYWERTRGFNTQRELPHAEGVLIVNLGAPIGITGGDGGERSVKFPDIGVTHVSGEWTFAPQLRRKARLLFDCSDG